MSNTETITVADIESMVQIIDVVTGRGAIRGDELLTVGTLRNKMVSFVEAFKSEAEKTKNAEFNKDLGNYPDATESDEE